MRKRRFPPMRTDDPAQDALDYDDYIEWENNQKEEENYDIYDRREDFD